MVTPFTANNYTSEHISLSASSLLIKPEIGLGSSFKYSTALDMRLEYKYLFGRTFSHSTNEALNINQSNFKQQSVQFSLVI